MDSLDFTSSQDPLFEFGSAAYAAHSYPPPPQQQQQQHSQQPHRHPQPSSSHVHPGRQTWPPLDLDSTDPSMCQQQQQQQSQQHPPTQQQTSRPSSNHAQHQHINLQTSGIDLDYSTLFPTDWQYQLQQTAQHQQQQQFAQLQHQARMNPYNPTSFGAQLQASPIDFMPSTTSDSYPSSTFASTFNALAGPMDATNALVYPLADYQPNGVDFTFALQSALNHPANDTAASSVPGSSPTGTILEVQSVSDNEWSMISYNPSTNRHSIDSFSGTVSNPSHNLHIRTHSNSSTSDGPHSAELSGSYEEIPPWPLSSPHDFHGSDYLDAQYIQHQHPHGLPIPTHQTSPASSLAISPTTRVSTSYRSSGSGSASTSPTSSGPTSPPLRRRKSPLEGKTTKAVIKKTPGPSNRKEVVAEKKVGRRRGPLRPDQRQQAHEIRKLRACLRCKFLKKTCDKGEPCGGCRPSHARLWQVPCTRMDIKDIGYFMKDWKADYERHVSLGFSVGNIKGFSNVERPVYITHGYGHYLPISAREVYVRDDKCFNMDWVESVTNSEFELNTAKLTAGMEGINSSDLSDYLDLHLDQGFESFVDEYFEGTKFISEILKTAYRYYEKERTPAVRKALKLVIAYNLTMHVTMIEGLPQEEECTGLIEDLKSRFSGKTVAPVMINFQVKCALADMWRELQKDILEELSSLYSSVYSGDKLKNWPTIFMLAAILLAIWEEMQFDCHYRVPDEKAVNKFCDDMESTPVGVIVGLFQAISTKLPGLQEWDTRKHHHLLNSNAAVCDALTEVKGHVNKYGKSFVWTLM